MKFPEALELKKVSLTRGIQEQLFRNASAYLGYVLYSLYFATNKFKQKSWYYLIVEIDNNFCDKITWTLIKKNYWSEI